MLTKVNGLIFSTGRHVDMRLEVADECNTSWDPKGHIRWTIVTGSRRKVAGQVARTIGLKRAEFGPLRGASRVDLESPNGMAPTGHAGVPANLEA